MRLLLLCALAAAVFYFWPRKPHYPDILIDEPPRQENISDSKQWQFKDHSLTALARYHFRALVLGAERYKYDRAAKVIPIDVALGWGPMSRANTVTALNVYQSGRWYNYSWRDRPPIPETEIIANSANTHMIPADRTVEKGLLGLRAGDILEAEGLLVEVKGTDGWAIKSSLSRIDVQGGSCEVMWVEKMRKLQPADLARRK